MEKPTLKCTNDCGCCEKFVELESAFWEVVRIVRNGWTKGQPSSMNMVIADVEAILRDGEFGGDGWTEADSIAMANSVMGYGVVPKDESK